MEITKEFRFEASHRLPKHPGHCSRLHGHSWRLWVTVEGQVNEETGFVMDFLDLKRVVQPIVDSLDHRHLGTWDGFDGGFDGESSDQVKEWGVSTLPLDFYPSSENLIWWFAEQLNPLNQFLVKTHPSEPYKLMTANSPGGRLKLDGINVIKNVTYWNRLTLSETCTSSCTLRYEEFRNQ